MAHQSRYEQDVRLAIAHDLVGDVHSAALHVARPRSWRGIALAPHPVTDQERWVLPQDPGLQLARLTARLDSQLLDEPRAQLAIGVQRLGLAPRAIQASGRFRHAYRPDPGRD